MTSIVQTAGGPVRGKADVGAVAFLGVPYAAPPFGPLFMQPPEAPLPWTKALDARSYGDVVPQIPMFGYFGEVCGPKHPAGPNCLNLNVWTPDPDATDLPVFVWFHGGGYFACSNTDDVYNGSSFANRGVVVVTVNYRLGALGYFHLQDQFPDLQSSDNLGLQDQVAALKWVGENIAAFGGDPDQVTIGGESAGAMSCQLLMASPHAKGLFSRAILQSPGVPNGYSKEEANLVTSRMLERLGVEPGHTRRLLTLSTDTLLQAHTEMAIDIATTHDAARYGAKVAAGNMPFQPVYGTRSLPSKPQAVIAEGLASHVDVLMGVTKDESSIVTMTDGGLFTPDVATNLKLVFDGGGDHVLEAYKAAYSHLSDHQLAVRIETDKTFTAVSYQCADNQSSNTPNVWFFRFDWETPKMEGVLGAHHFLDVPFVFNQLHNAQADTLIGDTKPTELAERIHRAWVSFIRTGDPNHEDLPPWPRYTASTRATMLLDTECAVQEHPVDQALLSLWNECRLM